MKDNMRLLPVATTCRCSGCEGLGIRYKGDLDLLAFLQKNLLKRGWAGSVDEIEAGYMMSHAPWYRAAVGRGRQSGFGKRFPPVGEAPAAKAGAEATTHPGTPPTQGKMPLGVEAA